MTVLWITLGVPYPPDSGARLRDFHLIREVSKSMTVLLFSLIPPGESADPGNLHQFCSRIETWQIPPHAPPLSILLHMPVGAWRHYYVEACERIRAIAQAEQPGVIQVEHSLLAGYLDAIPREIKCRTVISLHNVAFQQYRRMAKLKVGMAARIGYRLKSWTMGRTEKRYLPRFDLCLTVSRTESDLVKQSAPGANPIVIENGVDCGMLPLPQAGGVTVLFAGVIGYPPNADAALFFCRSVLPLIRLRVPRVKVLIVGHSPPAEVQDLMRDSDITVTGSVADIHPYYERAALTVAPLRAGGGTRLKILESMALGRAVVATGIGCEGLEVRDGVDLLMADDAKSFAECVTRLLMDPVLREQIARTARNLVAQHYDWPVIAKKLISAYATP